MPDAAAILLLMAAGMAGVAIASAAVLKGWSGWLDLRRHQFVTPSEDGPQPPSVAARIEMADLKERVRRLEAIASGTDI